MEPDKLMDDLSDQLAASLDAMRKTNVLAEKVAYSQIVRNMSVSLGAFLSLASDMMDADFDEDEEL